MSIAQMICPWRRRNRVAMVEARTASGFPVRQMFVLALCRICEPIAFMSIFPYIYYMIKSFEITSNDKAIAMYAGMVTSAFAFAEFASGPFWGRLSDVYGRKPILLMGLAGTGISVTIFGFSRDIRVALLARFLGGLLNGNIGVLQTTVAELVRDEAHRPRAYAIMPSIWCLGGIIGAAVGGCLSDPVRNLNFGAGTVLESFPYLLPNLVGAGVVAFSLTIGILFMEETHEEKRDRHDFGLSAGNWILRAVGLSKPADFVHSKAGEANMEEAAALMSDPGFLLSTETTPRVSHDLQQPFDEKIVDVEAVERKPAAGCAGALNRHVVFNIAAYGIIAYHTITLEQLLPVLLSMDVSSAPASLPFKFVGGFELPTTTIGAILALQGIYQMVAQLILFPIIIKRLGNLATFRLCTFAYPLLYAIAPYTVLLPESLRMVGLFAVLVWKVTLQAMAYPTNMLLLTNNAPSMLVLGTLNGMAASAASLARGVGPTLSGLLQTSGLEHGCVGLPYWISAAVAGLGMALSLYMQDMKEVRQQKEAQKQWDQALGRTIPVLDPAQSTRVSEDTLVEG